MGVFIILFVLLFCGSIVHTSNKINKNDRLIQTIVIAVLLILIQGLRHKQIGIDSYHAYIPFFEMRVGGWSSLFDLKDSVLGFEPGFVFFTNLIKTITKETQIYILVCSCISILPVSYIIYRYSNNIPLAFLIYAGFRLYHFGFSGVRQSIAVGLTVLAFEYVVQRQLWRFLAMVLIASLFHTSAILFMIAYPLYHLVRLSPSKMFFVILVFLVSLSFLDSIVVSLTSFIFGGEKYMNMASENSVPSYNLMILMLAFLFFTYISKDKRLDPLRPLLFMMVVFQSLGMVSNSASRMAFYFMPYLSIALPIALQAFKPRIIGEIIVAFLFIFFFFYFNGSGYLNVIPYKFFWE